MPKKTNKTSHVLNLITNGSSSENVEETDESASEKSEDKGTPQQKAVEKESSQETADKTSQESSPVKTPAEESTDKEQTSRTVPTSDKPVIVVSKPSQNDQLSSKILDSLTNQVEKTEEKKEIYRMVNVMEQIIKGMNLRKYMEQYEVCLCSRCQADVLALILTRLPAKYVVVDECPTAPIISFYESKFRVRIITEIIKACIDVKEKPRHGRLGPLIP